MYNMKQIAKFSSGDIHYRAELVLNRAEVYYRVSEVAPPLEKRYRYFKVTVIKHFNKVRTRYKKFYYDDFVTRHKFLGKIDGKALFDRVGTIQHIKRFVKIPVVEPYVKTKVYTKIKKKRIFVPRPKFNEFRNSFEFKTKANRTDGVLDYPRVHSQDYHFYEHFIYKKPVFIRSYEGTHVFGVVNPSPYAWFTNLWAIDEVYGLLPDSLGFSELVGASLNPFQYRQVIQAKFISLNKWVKDNGLHDETKRFLSDELNRWPYYSPFDLPFFNRQDQIYAIDEARGIVGFNRGLSALRTDYVDYFKSYVHGATFLGESPETFKMFLDIIKKLATVLIAAKRGDFKAAMSTLGLTSKKGVASNWLMLQYGIKPLLSDLKTLAEEANRREIRVHRFRSREFRKFNLELPVNWTAPVEYKIRTDAWVPIQPDDRGEWNVDSNSWNIAHNVFYSSAVAQGWDVNSLLPPLPHNYERTFDRKSDLDPATGNNVYSIGVYDHFWAQRMDFSEAAKSHFQKKKETYKTYPGPSRNYTLRRNYVLRTRLPAKYKWWEVLKLNELDLTAWELVPFSFVFDWFIPIGDYLEELASVRSVPRNVKFDLTIKDIVTEKETGYVYSRCDRMRDIDSTTSAFLNLESISWDPVGSFNMDRLLNAAALLQQLKK